MRPPLLAALAASVLGAAAPAGAAGDPLVLARPSVRAFTERDGLPQATVHAIATDREGFLWVGTQDGAARYDGRSWQTVDMPGRAVSNFVRSVLAARDGSVWFGREDGGLVRLRSGRTETFDAAAGLPASRVNHVLERADGTVWAATHGGGVARLEGDRFVVAGRGLPDPRVWRLAEVRVPGRPARLLAACGGGVFELADDGRWVPLDLGTSLEGASANSLLDVSEGPDAGLWVGTFGAGLFRLRDGHATRFGPDEGLSSRLVTALAAVRGSDGGLVVWAGTRDEGVFRLAGERFERVPLGALRNEVYSLVAGTGADDSTLWVGTRLAGLVRVQEAPWVVFDGACGLPADQVFSILEAPGPGGGAAIWLGTGSGVAVLEAGSLRTFGPSSGLPSGQVHALAAFPEPGGRPGVWASLIGRGLWRFDGERWRRAEGGAGARADDAGALLATTDEQGRPELWVGTERSGAAVLTARAWRTFGRAEGLPGDAVTALLATRGPAGRTVWIGTRGGGLAELSGGRAVAVHDRRNGLPNNHVLALAEVAGPGGRRELWVGTRGGLARRTLDGSGAGWTVLSDETRPALPNNSVFVVLPARDGSVFLGTNRGVARVVPRADAEGGLEVVTYGPGEGLPSAASNWGGLVDSRGRVWVATAAGASVFDPARAASRRGTPHPVAVESVEVDGVPRPPGQALRLGPSERSVAFEYALLAFHGESLIRYRTELAGWDAAPTGWVAAPRREFTNLAPGRYVFRVWGRDAAGDVSGPAEMPFEVVPAWWRQPVALVLFSLLAAALGLAAVRFRERTLRRRAEELETLVKLRTRELEEARDAAEAATESKGRFLAHMSHEVRTPINAILGYAEILSDELRERGTEELVADVEKISRAARQQLSLVNEALDHSKLEAGGAELHLTEFDAGRLAREAAETAWPLVRKGHNRLETKGLETLGAVFTDEGKLRQVLLNLLSNAARFTEGGAVTLAAEREGGEVVLRVEDTGVGMSPEQLARIFTPYAQASSGTAARFGGTGLGLAISRGYCELMRGSLEVASEPGRGTTFTVRLPARLERRTGRA